MPNTDEPHAEFAWRAHPARERAGRAALGAAVIAVLSVLVTVLMQSPGWGLLSVVVMVLLLNRFFFPTRFRIDDEGITAEYPFRRQRLRWAELRRFAHGAHGALLSARARPSAFDGSRAMHVLFGRERDSVLERIRAHLPEGAA